MGRRIGQFVAALVIAWCLVCRSATAEPLVVDTAYCSTRGGSFSGQCIHQALVELVADSATFDALLIEPGTVPEGNYQGGDGCGGGGALASSSLSIFSRATRLGVRGWGTRLGSEGWQVPVLEV